MTCPFCDINSKKTKILREGKFTRVIFSNPKLMPGHLLVVPKRHVLKISELNKEEKEELFRLVEEFQEKILEKISSGCDIRQNCRPFQKQDRLKIDHLHIHLQPRELFDELYEKCQTFEKDIFKETAKDEIEKVISLLG